RDVVVQLPTVGSIPVVYLIGEEEITLNVNDDFIDPGAYAEDVEDGTIPFDELEIDSNLNTSVLGTYLILYYAHDSDGNSSWGVQRTVIVADLEAPTITLQGDAEMNVAQGEVFTDPGATAIDNVDGDISA